MWVCHESDGKKPDATASPGQDEAASAQPDSNAANSGDDTSRKMNGVAPPSAVVSPADATAVVDPLAGSGLASGSMTVAVPRSSTALLPDFLRLLSSHADATYQDGSKLVKEWGVSNSTLEVRTRTRRTCLFYRQLRRSVLSPCW